MQKKKIRKILFSDVKAVKCVMAHFLGSICLLIPMVFISCGSFGEGLLMGLSNMGGYGNYGGGYSVPQSGGSMDYLLDPNYAVAQTVAQQNQYNQVFGSIATQTVREVNAQENRAYQEFCKFYKKSDGTDYTKNEWKALVGQAYQNVNNGNTSSSGGYSSSSGNSGTSSSKTCSLCHGIKKCWTCNGKRTFLNSLTGDRVACPNCTDGLCRKCHGTGRQ